MENTENYKTITAKEFLELLEVDNEIIILKNIRVREDFGIDAKVIKGKNITIESGKFGRIHIYDSEKTQNSDKLLKEYSINDRDSIVFQINGGYFQSIHVYEGHFSGFYISGGKLLNFHITGGNFNIFEINNIYNIIEHFSIQGGIFRELFTIDYGEFGTFNIYNGDFRDFEIKGGKFKDFLIKNANFNNRFTVSGGKFNRFCIEDGVFNRQFSIYDGQFGRFYIENGNFNDTLEIGVADEHNLTFEHEVKFIGGIFKKVRINNGEFKQGFALGSTKNESFMFYRGYFKYINVFGGDYGSLYFMYCKINQIKFNNNLATKYIYFDYDEHILSDLVFENCDIPAGTLIKISELPIENIIFINSTNFGNIVFSGVKGTKNKAVYSTLKINNSDLGKTTFIDCDFEEMELDFRSSKITEVFLAGTKMPLEIKKEHNGEKETNLDQQRLGYGQLKKIYENRGDTVSANDYFAKEMNVLYSQTSWQSFGEKFMLFLNKRSSNHGTSWLQALLATMIVAGVFFAFYGFSIGLSLGDYSDKDDRTLFFNYWSYLLEFINPIHKANFIVEDMNKIDEISKLPKQALKSSNLSRVIENLARIFITYFIYQLIQAFRKHKKSST